MPLISMRNYVAISVRGPSRVVAEIMERQVAVTALGACDLTRLQELLHELGDVERMVSRVGLGTASPRDLAKLRHGLGPLPAIRASRPRRPRSAAALPGCR